MQAILSLPANTSCCDCHSSKVTHVSSKLMCFLCSDCAQCHQILSTSLGTTLSLSEKDSLVNLDLESLRNSGNKRNRKEFEVNLPFFYRRPFSTCPSYYRMEFIMAKYIRREFVADNAAAQNGYNCFTKRGPLLKRLRYDNKTVPRYFCLDMSQNALKYFIKEDDATPKASLDLEKLNAALVDSEMWGSPSFSLMLTFAREGATRFLYVSSTEAKCLVDWYNAIRCCKFHRQCLAISGMNEPIHGDAVAAKLTQDILLNDWLEKTGPRASDAWRKRWVILMGRRLMYADEPLAAYPKKEVFLGNFSEGFTVTEGSPQNWKKHSGFCFTLLVPPQSTVMGIRSGGAHLQDSSSSLDTPTSAGKERLFVFMSQYREVRDKWLTCLRRLLETPASLEERKEANVQNAARVHSMKF